MTHSHLPPGTLPKPRLLGRLARGGLALILMLLLLPALPGLLWMMEHRRPLALGPIEVIGPVLATLWLFPSFTQVVGYGGKRRPRLFLLGLLIALSLWSWLATGDALGPILGVPVLFLMIGVLVLLSASFLLAALFAVPG